MPLYEYRCSKCGRIFELLRRRVEKDEAASCPDCGGEGRRIVSMPAVKTGESSIFDSRPVKETDIPKPRRKAIV